MCSDGLCAASPNGTISCAHNDDLIVGNWHQPVAQGLFILHSCPDGFSKRGLNRVLKESMECQKCLDLLNYIIKPDIDDCQKCPPGLMCRGDQNVIPVVNGSEWVLEGNRSFFRLLSCPAGFKVWPPFEAGAVFDPITDAPQQKCEVCDEGMECVLDRCVHCVQCPAGKYKDSPGTGPCRKCSAGKYNPVLGAASEALCLDCPEGSDTRGLEAQHHLSDCNCILSNYMTVNRSGPLGMRCYACPVSALCPDSSCGLRNSGFACTGIGSDLMPSVVGDWARRSIDERYSLLACPIGHQLINTTGYKLQACSKCPAGYYIILSTDPDYRCYKCPPGALCPKGGPPIFPEAELSGTLELSGKLPREQDLQSMIASSLNLDMNLAQIVSYDRARDQMLSLSESGRRQIHTPVVLQFKAFPSKANAVSSSMTSLDILADLHLMLAQAAGNQTELLGLSVQVTQTRNPGEVWREEDRVFVIKACPKGHLLVNSSLDEQMCWSLPFCSPLHVLA